MELFSSIFEATLGGLPAAVKTLLPERLKRRAAARFDDLNPFKTISANHDLVRALRIAWIEAACEVLDAAKPRAEADGEVARFEALARQELMAVRSAAFDRRAHPGDSAIDAHLHAALQGVPEFGEADRDQVAGRSITRDFTATLGALTGWDEGEVPAVFGQIANAGLPTHGGGQARGFGELVFAAFADLIKDPKKYPEAREAFYIAMDKVTHDLAEATLTAMRGLDGKLDTALAKLDAFTVLRDGAARYLENLPEITSNVVRIDVRTERIEATQQEQGAMLAELLDIARQSGRFQRAAEQGISEAAVRAIVERLGGDGIAREDLIKWLDDWIEAAQRELGKQTNEDEAFEAARCEAERRFKAGQIAEASSTFIDAFEREQQTEQVRREESKRRRLRLLEEAVRWDELAFDGEAAAAKLRLMAEVEGLSGADAVGGFLFDKGGEFYDRGNRKGDNAALLVSIGAYRAALQEYTRQSMPLMWAKTQSNLGGSLEVLGERESGTMRLKEAVTAYRAAMEELPRERLPLDWATIQNNLGNVFLVLGTRENGTARLEKAVAAYRNALQERTRELVPPLWAMTQFNLGNALRTLGERESGTEKLEEAVTALRSALQERIRELVPLDWATTQNNLGLALWALGRRESGTLRLEEAVTALRAALEEFTHEQPLYWALMQHNLGGVLISLATRENDGRARLKEAVTALGAALQERTRQRAPFHWALTRESMANAFRSLAARTTGAVREEHLMKALAAVDDALAVYREGNAAYYIEKSERLRATILAEQQRRAD